MLLDVESSRKQSGVVQPALWRSRTMMAREFCDCAMGQASYNVVKDRFDLWWRRVASRRWQIQKQLFEIWRCEGQIHHAVATTVELSEHQPAEEERGRARSPERKKEIVWRWTKMMRKRQEQQQMHDLNINVMMMPKDWQLLQLHLSLRMTMPFASRSTSTRSNEHAGPPL